MRKILVCLLLVGLVIGLAYGVWAAEKINLVLAIPSREMGAVIPNLIAKFEASHPNIKVEWQKVPGVPNELHTLYVNFLTGGSPTPDVFAIDMIWPGEFIANHWATPLDKYFPPEEQAEFLPAMVKTVKTNGHVYGVPLYMNGLHLYYRTDLLQKYGLKPPDTWEQLIQEAQTILTGEHNPMLKGYVSMWAEIEGLFMNYLQFLWGAGGSFFDSKGNVSVNSPEGVKALQTMVDMIYKYHIAPVSILTYKPNDARVVFQQGNAVFMVVQDFVWPMLTAKDSPVRNVVAFKRVPYFKGHSDANTTCLGGWVLVVNPFSKYKAEAAELTKSLTSYDSQLETAITTGCFPTRKAVYNDPKLTGAYKGAKQQYADYLVGDVRPSMRAGARYPQLSDIMQKEISAALHRQKTPQQALDDAAAKIKQLLSGS